MRFQAVSKTLSVATLLAAGFLGVSALARADDLARVNALKAEIRQIAVKNSLRSNNLAEVRAQLDPLLQELAQLVPPSPAADQLGSLKGTWKQLWTDNAQEDSPWSKYDRTKAFQYVSDKGYYYNVAPYALRGIVLSVFLKGEYVTNEDALDIRFTKLRLAFGDLKDTESIAQAVENVESGEKKTFGLPFFGNQGPVGKTGKLFNTYVDKDFRIAESLSPGDTIRDVFIMDKVQD